MSAKTLTIVGFLLPSVLIYFVLVIMPIFQASYYSLFKWNGLVPALDNWPAWTAMRALRDGVFIRICGHNILIAVLSAVTHNCRWL